MRLRFLALRRPDHLVNEAAVGSEIREVAASRAAELVAKHIL